MRIIIKTPGVDNIIIPITLNPKELCSIIVELEETDNFPTEYIKHTVTDRGCIGVASKDDYRTKMTQLDVRFCCL